MRPLSDGVIPYGESSTSKSSICDVCLGMYKHGMFAPNKAEGLGCPPITQKNVINQIDTMFASWQVPKFHCNNAAIKGDGI